MNITENPNDSGNPSQETGAKQQPARRRPRRATRPVMAPADAPEENDAPVPADASENTAEPAESPDRPRRGRTGRGASEKNKTDVAATEEKKSSAVPAAKELDVIAEFGGEKPVEPRAAAVSGDDISLDDLVLPERAPGASAKKSARQSVPSESEPAPAGEGQAPADADEDSPRLPATALLFQAPEITPRRSRRSRAAATAPGEEHAETGGQDTLKKDAAQKDTPKKDTPKKEPAKKDAAKKEPAKDGPGTTDSDEPGATRGPAEDAADSSDADSSSEEARPRRRRRRGGRGRRRSGNGGDSGDSGASTETADDEGAAPDADDSDSDDGSTSRRRRRRPRSDSAQAARDAVTPLKGSTRLEAKRQRRREGREARRRRTIITEAEFLARRESVERKMYVRESDGRTQIVVLEDGILVEHYVAQKSQTSMVGNVYLGRVQNVLPSMEAAFVDIGRGRNAVLYAGEVNWDAAGLEGQPRRIEQALKSGDFALVQVTKDPIGTKGARLTAQVTLAGRFLVLVPNGSMTGISRKLPEGERNRLKKLLKDLVPEGQGVIVRTAAEGATEEQLRRDIDRLASQWAEIEKKQAKGTSNPVLLKGEPELATRVVRDIFNEDFTELVISGEGAWKTLSGYVNSVAPDLSDRVIKWAQKDDIFAAHRIDEQLTKGTDRKVYLPSGGSLVIDRTEAMTVVDVNTGKYTGSGGTLEETVTKNNLEAAEEIVRQLRLRDIGGIIVIDFIDMVLESNRELVLRRLVECLGRDRTRHQVAEVTSLGLVQMTRKRVGQGLVEAFSTPCECCNGRGFIVDDDLTDVAETHSGGGKKSGGGRGSKREKPAKESAKKDEVEPENDHQREQLKATLQAIAAATSSSGDGGTEPATGGDSPEAGDGPAEKKPRRSSRRASAPKQEPAPDPKQDPKQEAKQDSEQEPEQDSKEDSKQSSSDAK